MQDVAIAYGFNNIPKQLPAMSTLGGEQPINQLSDLLRLECAMAGFTEILTWALCSRAENFGHLLLPDDGASAVGIGNPATAEFEVCRTSLLPGKVPAFVILKFRAVIQGCLSVDATVEHQNHLVI